MGADCKPVNLLLVDGNVLSSTLVPRNMLETCGTPLTCFITFCNRTSHSLCGTVQWKYSSFPELYLSWQGKCVEAATHTVGEIMNYNS